jgi:probable rRNA maturation factor
MSTEDSGSDPEEPPGGIAVEVSDTQSFVRVDREAVAGIVRGALAAEGLRRASVSVALVDDATIRTINRRHLGHDWPTDVISFTLSKPGEGELCGELVVSAETAMTTAHAAGVGMRDELALYLVHGVLHLCGYDDEGAADREAMRRREGEILAMLGLANTFPAAAAPASAAGTGTAGRGRAGWTV